VNFLYIILQTPSLNLFKDRAALFLISQLFYFLVRAFFPHIYFLLFSFPAFLISSLYPLFLLAGSHTQFDLLEHPCCWQKFRFIFFRTFFYADLLCFLFSFCSARHSEEVASVVA